MQRDIGRGLYSALEQAIGFGSAYTVLVLFDSTSGEVVGNDHIVVAVHRHPEAVPPVAGAFVEQLRSPQQCRSAYRMASPRI